MREDGTDLIDHTAYRFQLALTDAIALYIHELRTLDQFRGLTYRGADLGRAVAVELYFRLINDTALRNAFARDQVGETLGEDPDAIPVSTTAYWVLRQMLGRRPRFFSRARWKDYARRSWRMGRAHLWSPGLATPPAGTVLILALSKRFFDYLMPIRKALGPDVVWLAPAGAGWIEQAKADGENIIIFRGDPDRKPAGALTKPLEDHWPELAVRFDEFHEILEQVRPSAVVVTEGNQANDEILARAADNAGIRSICIQQGWSPVVHSGFRGMRYDTFCVWGTEFGKLLRPYNPDQCFAATGSHRVGSREPGPQPTAISFFLQNNSVLITPRAWKEMLDLVGWTAETAPQRPVLVREHPASPLTQSEKSRLGEIPNIFLCPPDTMSLGGILGKTAIAVAFYSTTLVEALAYQAVPLVINITGAPRYNPDLEKLGAGMEVHDFTAARAAMTRLLSGEEDVYRRKLPALAPRFFAAPPNAALRNIAAIVRHQP